VAGWLDQFQRRHPATGFPLAVVYKFLDDFGGYLAALIAYYAFVSLFPLLLILSTVLGFVLSGHPDLQQKVIDSTLSEFPIIGSQLGQPERIGGGTKGLIIGIVGSLYGGLGVAQALQYAMNTVWTVPRHERRNPLAARVRGLLLIGTAGIAVIGTTVLSTFGASRAGSLDLAVRVLLLLASVAVNAAVFVLAFRLAPARRLSWSDVVPGALTAAVLWQLLQSFGVVYVGHVVKNASATNGVFALVLGLLAFFYLTSVVIVVCAEINAVRIDRLFPRALLAPFTDRVNLTRGDESAYEQQAQAQRAKDFEDVQVTFDGAQEGTPDGAEDEAGDEDETGDTAEWDGPDHRS
jgi:membrane protein